MTHDSLRPTPRTVSEADLTALRGAKSALRHAVALRRASLSELHRAEADALRTARVRDFLAHPTAAVATYLSVADEPDTLELMTWLTSIEVAVWLPVHHREGPRWARYRGPDQLRAGRYGIPEPVGPTVSTKDLPHLAAMIVPGLAGNVQGHRLGRGGGWYDRVLAELPAAVVRVLLLHEEDLLPIIPQEPNDQCVDVILTEAQTVTCLGDSQ